MNVVKNIMNLLGSKDKAAEFNNLKQWKSEAEETLANLQNSQMSLDKAIDEMKDYKHYDKASAYASITGESYQNDKVRSISWLAVASAAAIVLLFGVYFMKSNIQAFNSEILAAETMQNFILKDNSVVTLDRASKLTTLGSRKVALNGRAFFKVQSTPTKDKFIIELNKGNVTVLGTRFSIITDKNTNEVSVEEGKVQYEYMGQKIILTAGQSASLINDKLVQIKNGANTFSWMNQILEFIDTPIVEAIKDVSRHYNVAIEIEQSISLHQSCLLTTKVKNENVDQFMKELKSIFGITYHKKGTGFVITSIKC